VQAEEREVLYYRTLLGDKPFRRWRQDLVDSRTKAAIDARIARARAGNFGDHKAVGTGVVELVIDFGPGYRIYCGIDGARIVLLCTGDKSTQDADIGTAKRFWDDYRIRSRSTGKKNK
jgi:putative addiction module killer protein